MGDERIDQLLDELKSVRNREVEILTELFQRQAITPRTVPTSQVTQVVPNLEPSSRGVSPDRGTSQQLLTVGDRVKVLSSGVGCKIGDTGVITKVTQKDRYRILLDKNSVTITRSPHKVIRV